MKKPYPARAAGSATPKATKVPTKPTGKPVIKPRMATTVLKMTKTPDGGQQYVPNNDPEVVSRVTKDYFARARQKKTLSPKVAEALGKAEIYAAHPSDPYNKKLADTIGKTYRDSAERHNANTRKYGDKTRR